MRYLIIIIAAALTIGCSQKTKTSTSETAIPEVTSSSSSEIVGTRNFHFFSIPTLDESGTIDMKDYKGKKILVVNVASKCGFTPQYEGLQELHTKYGDQVQIIGFPCNQFMNQEPGGKEEIASFCKKNFGVTFPLTTKIDVKGSSQNEIYTWLTSKDQNGKGDYKVSWNFNKFLIDESGNLLEHYGPKVTPMSEELLSAITK